MGDVVYTDEEFNALVKGGLKRVGLAIRDIEGKGQGLVATKRHAKKDVIRCQDLGGDVVVLHEVAKNINDAVLPDFLRLLVDSDGDVDKMFTVFKEYQKKSLAGANVVEQYGPEAYKLMADFVDQEDIYQKMSKTKFELRLLKNVTAGDELVRHYNLQWIIMHAHNKLFRYDPRDNGLDHWQSFNWVVWDLLDMYPSDLTETMAYGRKLPEKALWDPRLRNYQGEFDFGDGYRKSPEFIWVSRETISKWTKSLRELFLKVFQSMDSFEERAVAKFDWNHGCYQERRNGDRAVVDPIDWDCTGKATFAFTNINSVQPTSSGSAPRDDQPSFAKGQRVKSFDLKNAAHLNGLEATVLCAAQEEGRWNVQFDEPIGGKCIKGENLRLVLEETSPAPEEKYKFWELSPGALPRNGSDVDIKPVDSSWPPGDNEALERRHLHEVHNFEEVGLVGFATQRAERPNMTFYFNADDTTSPINHLATRIANCTPQYKIQCMPTDGLIRGKVFMMGDLTTHSADSLTWTAGDDIKFTKTHLRQKLFWFTTEAAANKGEEMNHPMYRMFGSDAGLTGMMGGFGGMQLNM